MTRSLDEISREYHLDKNIASGYHNYIPAYTELFEPIRDTARHILEIGIGSVENREMLHVIDQGYRSGNSLRCWQEYFTNAEHIHGADIHAHPELDGDGKIRTFVANQTSREQLKNMLDAIGAPLDVIIDDGNHQPGDQAQTFEFLCDYLTPGGIYAIEDIQPPFIDMFADLSIFVPDFRKRILEEFEVKSFDSRAQGMPDDFILSFRKKT
jgi:hypothetical protein